MEGRVYIVNIKSWTSLNFYVYTQPFMHCLHFIYARKFHTPTLSRKFYDCTNVNYNERSRVM